MTQKFPRESKTFLLAATSGCVCGGVFTNNPCIHTDASVQ